MYPCKKVTLSWDIYTDLDLAVVYYFASKLLPYNEVTVMRDSDSEMTNISVVINPLDESTIHIQYEL